MPTFEEFDRQAAPPSADPAVTIQKKGILSFNRGMFEAMGQPQAVKLLFDRTARIIAFRRVPQDTHSSYAVRKQGGSSNYLVAGTAFCKFYGIDTTQTRRYNAQYYDDVLGVDLNGDATTIIGARDQIRRVQSRAAADAAAAPHAAAVG